MLKRFMWEWIKRQSHLDQKNSMMPLAKTFTDRWVYAYRNECVLGQINDLQRFWCIDVFLMGTFEGNLLFVIDKPTHKHFRKCECVVRVLTIWMLFPFTNCVLHMCACL